MMSPKQRWMILGGLLALTLLAMYLVQEPAEEIASQESVSQAGAQQENLQQQSSPKESALKESSLTKAAQQQRSEPATFANNPPSQSAIKVAEEAISVLPDLTQKHVFVVGGNKDAPLKKVDAPVKHFDEHVLVPVYLFQLGAKVEENELLGMHGIGEEYLKLA